MKATRALVQNGKGRRNWGGGEDERESTELLKDEMRKKAWGGRARNERKKERQGEGDGEGSINIKERKGRK